MLHAIDGLVRFTLRDLGYPGGSSAICPHEVPFNLILYSESGVPWANNLDHSTAVT